MQKSEEQILKLRQAGKKKEGAAVEDLLCLVLKAMAAVQDAEVTTGSDVLIESMEILRQYVADFSFIEASHRKKTVCVG